MAVAVDPTGLNHNAQDLRSRHRRGDPLILPNAWDPPSAHVVEEAGFPAIATSSVAMMAALGLRDGGCAPPDLVFAAIARIATAVHVPVSADIENGYGLSPTDLVRRLIGAGACGMNLEDTLVYGDGGTLVDASQQAERLSLIREAAHSEGVNLVLNARIDTYLRLPKDGGRQLDETFRRAEIYAQAGADSVYPIFMPDEDMAPFAAAHAGPVNALSGPDKEKIGRLKGYGAARVSMGGALSHAVTNFLAELLNGLA